MPINIGANTVGSIFATNSFRVPHYQRAYAWADEPHLRDFLGDLLSHPTASKRPYYLGTVLLTQSSAQESARLTQYDVVDGQQRLTTITIFVSVAIKRLAQEPEHAQSAEEYTYSLLSSMGRYRLFKTIDEDDAFFERFIVGDETASETDCDTPSQRRLAEAKRYFTKQLDEIHPATIAQSLETLYNSTILVYAVDSPIEATQIFEFQNDRGKRLTNLEALKSFLMHGIYLHGGETTESDLRYVQAQFAKLYRTAEAIEGEILAPGEDQLLGYHCAAYLPQISVLGDEGWRRPKELVRHILRTPSVLGDLGAKDFIKSFSAQLADTFGDALKILQARVGASSVASLFVLGRTAALWPLMLKTWRHAQSTDPSQFERVARAMERFSSATVLANVRADMGESRLRSIAAQFSGDFESLVAEIENLRTWWEIPTRLATALDGEGFYHHGRAARYVLWKYENSLRSLPGKKEQKLSWREMVQDAPTAEQYGLDHILAQDDETKLLETQVKWDPTDADEVARPFRDVMLHRLGNLVLDTRSTGASKGSKAFGERIENYSVSTFVSQKELASRFATRKEDGKLDWDAEAIRKRHEVLKSFALTQL